jgi:hypothetical protein
MKIGIAKYSFTATTSAESGIEVEEGDHMVILSEYEDNGYWFVDDFSAKMAKRPWKAYEARLLSGIVISAIHHSALDIID